MPFERKKMTQEERLNIIKKFSKSKYIETEIILEISNLLEADLIFFQENIDKTTLLNFLFWNCDRFNRFSTPGPLVLEKDSINIFKKLLSTFENIDDSNNNSASLNLDKFRWEIFDHIANHKLNHPNLKNIETLINDFIKIKKPDHADKLKEYKAKRSKFIQLLSGYIDSSITTKIDTTIPVAPVRNKTVIKTNYWNKELTVVLSPEFYDNRQSIVNTGQYNINVPITKSQWQNCICKVEIEINGLIDPIKPAPILSLPHGHKLPIKNWPYLFNYVYHLLENISWKIYKPSDQIGRWLITPNDLGNISWSVYSHGHRFEHSIKDPPGLLSYLTGETNTSKELEIDNVNNETAWYDKCLIIAKDYLAAGNTNESIFWLNVGIEALFEYRTNLICSRNGLDYETLNSGKTYWFNAKEVVEKYLPDSADKIEWPDKSIGIPSWYSKINFLNKEVGFQEPKKMILKHYNNINKHRNALFHGNIESQISSEIVSKGIDSYIWLIENFE